MARFEAIFRDICDQAVEEDGLVFVKETVRGEKIKEEENYEGVRLRLDARLEKARVGLQVDIAFGDAVTPAPVTVDYPSLLELPTPKLAAYPRESVIAEKFEAMVKLGIANSRMKDFYDVYSLAQLFEFGGLSLCTAIKATFERRGTAIPGQTPLPLSPEFHEDPAKIRQWQAFVRRGSLGDTQTLGQVTAQIHQFLLPPTLAIAQGEPFRMFWPQRGPWKSDSQ